MSVATESPEKDTIEAIEVIESLDNRDNADPRRRLERLECMGSAPWLDADISSILFKPPNDSVDSDSFMSDLLEEFLFLRSNKPEVKELRPRNVLPNGLLAMPFWPASPSVFQTKFSLVFRRMPPAGLLRA